MNHLIAEVTDPDRFAALGPVVHEYMQLIADELARNFAVSLDPAPVADGTMSTPEKYLPPQGRTFMASDDTGVIGMGFLRPIRGTDYEIKRLYVRPETQGSGLGRGLLHRIMQDTRDLGGKRLFLDTLSSLKPAIRLYESEGFRFIDPYPGSDVAALEDVRPHAVFMVRDI